MMYLSRKPVSYLLLIQRWNSSRISVDSVCFGQPQHEFSSAGIRRVASELRGAESPTATAEFAGSDAVQAGKDGDVASCNRTTNVSLYSAVQTFLPELYAQTPTHASMPGGGRLRGEKYVCSAVQATHPVRHYRATAVAAFQSSAHQRSPQGVQGFKSTATPDSEHLRNPCPQGIQGDECSQFKLWLSNCLRHDGVDCGKLANDYTSGRRTLTEIFQQYERDIRAVQFVPKRRYSTAPKDAGDSQAPAAATPAIPPQPLTTKQKLKQAVKDYGTTVVVFHVTISLASLGACYVAVSSNIDILAIMAKLGASQDVLTSLKNATTFVIAYAVHKMLAPVRIGITLSATPVIVKYLRAKGILKVPKPPA